jgi:hypothetical protein
VRRPALAFLLLALGAGPASALWLGARARSVWTSEPPEIDGRREDWKLLPEDDAGGVLYGVSNDDRYLYLIIVPHTRAAREQLAGVYLQDLILWFDPKGAKNKHTGAQIAAPERLDQTWRHLEPLRLPPAEDALVYVAPVNARGALEARIPLSWLGSPRPRAFTLGLEAQVPRRPPAPPPRRSRRDEPDWGPPRFEAFSLWLRLTLAAPQK